MQEIYMQLTTSEIPSERFDMCVETTFLGESMTVFGGDTIGIARTQAYAR